MERKNIIIDTDPGVDDTAAICLSFNDKILDIKLITTVRGNMDIKTVTRNALHILEKFNKTDIPIAQGANKAMFRNSPDAMDIHQKYGMGGYTPPEKVSLKPIKLNAVEAMYKTICEYKNNISIVELAPHTNLGTLIKKHPDVIGMIDHIYTEGCAPYGWKGEGKKWINYCSFNARTDPEALKIVIESGIPITLIPSRMGRELANFNYKEVQDMAKINETGKFISEMYSGYWEKGYKDKRIATNDTCAMLLARFPQLFKTIGVDVEVDTKEMPGRTFMTPNPKSHIKLAREINKEKMHKDFFNAIKKTKINK